MKVVKHSGHIVDFDVEKLRKSLLRSGVGIDLVNNVVHKILEQVYEGITTRKIYKLAFALLKKESGSHAARYNLRAALQMLGPAGFFFEKFIARLFQKLGYQTQTNLFLKGKCVQHEIDVVIQKEGKTAIVECKFHATNDAVTDVKVPMYILSRFNDVSYNEHELFGENRTISECYLVTNNRFTSDAIAFGECSGLHLMSWDYPKQMNIRGFIDQEHLYPITCLTSLTMAEKEKLLIQDVILVREIPKHCDVLENIGISPNRIKNVLKEVSDLCHSK